MDSLCGHTALKAPHLVYIEWTMPTPKQNRRAVLGRTGWDMPASLDTGRLGCRNVKLLAKAFLSVNECYFMCADISNESVLICTNTPSTGIEYFLPSFSDTEQRKWTSGSGKNIIATEILAVLK